MQISGRRRRAWMVRVGVACACIAVPLSGTAQQTVPFENGSPIAPAGFEPQPIPAEPIEYDTAEVMRIRVVPVARGLVNPWSLAFLLTPRLRSGQAAHAPGDGKGRTLADHPQRRARPQTHPRCPGSARPGPIGTAGRSAASAVCHQPLHLFLVPETRRRRETGRR